MRPAARTRARRAGGRQRLYGCPFGVAVHGVFLAVTMNHVDGVVHPDTNGERRYDRGNEGVGNTQQSHGSQHRNQDEYDRPHGYNRQRRLTYRDPEKHRQNCQGRSDCGADRLRLPFRNGFSNSNGDDAFGGNRDVVAVSEPELLYVLLDCLCMCGVARESGELDQNRIDAIWIVDQQALQSGLPGFKLVEELLH